MKHIVAGAQIKNFHKAAESVHISQPALTKSIQKAEALLGVKLFERNSELVKPTKYGNFVVNNAHSIIGSIDKIPGGIATLKTGKEDIIKIGIHPVYSSFLVDAIGSVFGTENKFTFDFKVFGHLEAVKSVLEREIDLYIGVISNIYAQQYPELRFEAFPISELVYVVNANHPLAEKVNVADVEILNYDWIGLDNRSTIVYKKWLMEALSLKYDELEKQIRVFVPDYTVLKKLLLQSDYITIMPKILIKKELSSGELAEIKPKWKIPHIEVEGFLMYLDSYSIPPHLEKFVEGIKKSIAQ